MMDDYSYRETARRKIELYLRAGYSPGDIYSCLELNFSTYEAGKEKKGDIHSRSGKNISFSL